MLTIKQAAPYDPELPPLAWLGSLLSRHYGQTVLLEGYKPPKLTLCLLIDTPYAEDAYMRRALSLAYLPDPTPIFLVGKLENSNYLLFCTKDGEFYQYEELEGFVKVAENLSSFLTEGLQITTPPYYYPTGSPCSSPWLTRDSIMALLKSCHPLLDD